MDGESEDEPLVLLVETDRTVADSVTTYGRREAGLRFHVADGGPAARDRLVSGPVDCLVVDLDTLEEDGTRFVPDVETVAPGCPVVLLTDREPDAIPDDVLTAAASIVEKGPEQDDWEFLVEKVRGAIRTASRKRDDHEMYRMLVESARDGLYRLDANGNTVYLNESFADMLGYSREEALGRHASHVMAEGELERGQQIVRQVLESDDRESDIMDMEMVTAFGERITVAVHFVVLTTEDGEYDGLMGVARDITGRKERERELERKNERLEKFASIVSHDLRNPLNVAEGQLELAREDCDSEHLDEVAHALDRMETLVDDLLALAREGEHARDTEAVDLAEIADRCWRSVETGGATLRTETDATLRADPRRLQQLLENLVRNSIEHGSTSAQPQTPEAAVEHGSDVTITIDDLDDGEGFYVADDGPGIPPKERDLVFETGHSTASDGTGFGLSIVQEIVEAHDWTITVTESDSGGARFEISDVDLADR